MEQRLDSVKCRDRKEVLFFLVKRKNLIKTVSLICLYYLKQIPGI